MKKEKLAKLDKDTCSLICPIAAGMVGLCLTTIGLIRVAISINKINTLADDLLSADAILFLIATLTSYFALRKKGHGRIHILEFIADKTFIIAMSMMVLICIFITYYIA